MDAVLRIGWKLKAIPIAFVAAGFGYYLDQLERENMTRFRGKSKLYGREYGPDEKPPWP